jgi:phosphoribosylformimino-5-aminoimidazole carboxamide ribotide isomerase
MNKMLLIIPHIELSDGRCNHCIQATPGKEQLYESFSKHPLELAKLWRRENAKTLQITDNDSYEVGTIQRHLILLLAQSVDIPIQLSCQFQSVEECATFLDQGIYRVVIGELALKEPEGVKALLKEYTPSRVVFGLLSQNEKFASKNSEFRISDLQFEKEVFSLGGRRIIYTDLESYGTLLGPNYVRIQNLASQTRMKLTVGGGIAMPEHIWKLQEISQNVIDSVIIGKALYENKFPCQKIWRLIEEEIEQEIHEVS